MNHPLRFTLTGALVALLLTACSSGEDTTETSSTDAAPAAVEPDTSAAATQETEESSGSSGATDPCALLTPSQIEAITGFPVGEGVADPDRQTEYSSLCEWTQTGDQGTVTIALAPGYPVPYQEEETPLGKTVKTEIPGATDAYSVSDGLSVGMSVDGTYVAVAFSGALDGERADVTIALATAVAAALS